eukprot:g1905.t1
MQDFRTSHYRHLYVGWKFLSRDRLLVASQDDTDEMEYNADVM